MTRRRPCPPAPGPLEAYAAAFDDCSPRWPSGGPSGSTCRGCCCPRERNKTLTALAGTEPVVGAQAPGRPAAAVLPVGVALGGGGGQRAAAGAGAGRPGDGAARRRGAGHRRHRRPQGRHADRARRPAVPGLAGQGGQRDRRGDQPVGRRAGLLPAARHGPTPRPSASPRASATRPSARSPSWPWSWSTRRWRPGCPSGRWSPTASTATTRPSSERWAEAELPYVLALKPSRGTWAPVDQPHTPEEAAQALPWGGPTAPGDWTPVVRASATGTPRPGGRPSCACSPPARSRRCAWWWPRPTRPPCPR